MYLLTREVIYLIIYYLTFDHELDVHLMELLVGDESIGGSELEVLLVRQDILGEQLDNLEQIKIVRKGAA